ncbi:GNAT family N-acetyltransferase [Kitasatospora sp. NBC_01287]|uniref:GNAT family N-acetyltransferase n=1 Tax=Kitasatospora sp. NBC_01287 TaxID=2903573 RepID=UPI0022549AAE|nr:GNAT family N-acetyltransferase [Kitasatospora sp. NBC_01287]MCX4748166.1 GNAT family N-acetyltransferase [Kitasatospora sp. NBC_01287]
MTLDLQTLDIQPLDPHHAPEQLLADYHAMRAATVAVDTPKDPPLSYEAAIGRLRTPPLEDGPWRFWVGHLDGRLAGSVGFALPEGPNSGIVNVEVQVHPELRRRGVGTALLRAVLPAVLETRRDTVLGFFMNPDSPAARWAGGLGFEVTQSMVLQVLPIASTPAQLWDVPVPTGYRLEQWTGVTPEPLIDSYAVARQAIEDAPLGRTSYLPTPWTPARIRETDRELAAAGTEQLVVVAIEDATDQVVGVHVIHRPPHRRELGLIQDTSVPAAHRGHGLGLAMKAAMMRRLTDERPEMERILTTTATTNTHMIGINEALGYHAARTVIWSETATARLAERLTASSTGS